MGVMTAIPCHQLSRDHTFTRVGTTVGRPPSYSVFGGGYLSPVSW
jgi:hypothetical protein